MLRHLPRPGPIEWICLAAGLFLSLQYAWVMDDAYVYFRYIENLLVLDYGLVYNHGEYVEGFSSPLWLLLLTALRATGLDYWFLLRCIAVASFTCFWALLIVVNRLMSPRGSPVVNVPLVYLSTNYAVLS